MDNQIEADTVNMFIAAFISSKKMIIVYETIFVYCLPTLFVKFN